MTETCSRCGDGRPLREVIVRGGPKHREVICPDCAESEDRVVTDGGESA